MLAIGSVAPDFTATLEDGSTFHLADYRGTKSVVLYFYPKDFTPGCTKEACSFRDNYDVVEARDAIMIGVSADSNDAHQSFRDEYKLPFHLIADPSRALIGLYGARGFVKWQTQRVTYVIDRAGVIRAAFHHEIKIGRHTTRILEALDAIAASDEAVKAAG